MIVRLLPWAALALAAAVAAVLLLGGEEEPYEVKLKLANAGGLSQGSPVVIGGLPVGKVDLDISDDDRAEITLKIERRYEPIGRDASAAIYAQNVLGQKQVKLEPGDRERNPAPDGYQIPADRVSEATDLDQVLSVLDAPTRTRLAVLINEAGATFAGRRIDVSTFVRDFAPALREGGKVLNDLGAENRTLRNLVATSDRLVGEVTRKRGDLVRLVDRVGQASVTLATERRELRATLAEAPSTLASLRSAIADLRTTSRPLGSASRRIEDTAPAVVTTLDALEPFRRSAQPALNTATEVAPDLTRLSRRATPVLNRAVPTLRSLADLAGKPDRLPGVDRTLDSSLFGILSVVHGWSRAIQYRDGLSHIFRGELQVAPDMLTSLIDRGIEFAQRGRGQGPGESGPELPRRERAAAPRAIAPAPQGAAPRPEPATAQAAPNPRSLLDLLLGR